MTRQRRGERDTAAALPIAVFASALVVRLIYLWQIRDSVYLSVLIGDARAYDAWARRIAAGDWLGSDVFYQAPLYPYLLATIYTLFGHDLTVVRIVQAIGGSLACVALALAGRRLFSPRAGALAGFALAFYAPAIFFDGLIQKTTLDVLLVCVALWWVSGLVDEPGRAWRWLALGVTLGALALTRENALVFVPVVLAWAVFARTNPESQIPDPGSQAQDPRLQIPRRRPEPRPLRVSRSAGASALATLRPAGALLAGVALILGPVVVRNLAVGGGLYLTTAQFGPNFYIGNNPEADGTYRALRAGRGTAEFEQADAIQIAQREVGRALTPAEVSGYWSRRASSFITTEPAAWIRLQGRKLALLANRQEMVDTESQESYAEESTLLRLAGLAGHFGLLLPLAALGWWAARDRIRQAWVVPAMMAAYAASVLMFYVVARYRYPLVPFLILLAAGGLAALPARARAWSRREAGVCAAVVLAVAAAANWPGASASSAAAMQATSEINLGAALQADGRAPEAVERYQKAGQLAPGDATALVNLGTALHEAGRDAEAERALNRAVTLQPGSGEAHYFLGRVLLDQGRAAEAAPHLAAAAPLLQSAALSVEARLALGIALASQNRFADAVREFRAAVAIDPTRPQAHWNLGTALAAAGQPGEARPPLEEAIRLDPGNGEAHVDLGDVLLALNEPLPAAAEFRAASRLRPESADVRNRLGIALATQGDLAAAAQQFEAALRLDPTLADAQRNLAQARGAIGLAQAPASPR